MTLRKRTIHGIQLHISAFYTSPNFKLILLYTVQCAMRVHNLITNTVLNFHTKKAAHPTAHLCSYSPAYRGEEIHIEELFRDGVGGGGEGRCVSMLQL